jgi:hypothetical protein
MLFATLSVAAAADYSGTWKLNTAKSKYTGIPMPKEQTATYTPKGTGYEYVVKGTSATGQPIQSSFTYVKDGEEAKATGFPYWDSMVIKGGTSNKTTVTLKRAGKNVGTVHRTLSADGKTLTLNGTVTLPDGKKGTYLAVYDKQ